MIESRTRGVAEMASAMTISGTIGLFVVFSQQPLANVVFWRCAFGAATLLAICAALGLLRPGTITMRQIGLAALGGVAIVALSFIYPIVALLVDFLAFGQRLEIVQGISVAAILLAAAGSTLGRDNRKGSGLGHAEPMRRLHR